MAAPAEVLPPDQRLIVGQTRRRHHLVAEIAVQRAAAAEIDPNMLTDFRNIQHAHRLGIACAPSSPGRLGSKTRGDDTVLRPFEDVDD